MLINFQNIFSPQRNVSRRENKLLRQDQKRNCIKTSKNIHEQVMAKLGWSKGHLVQGEVLRKGAVGEKGKRESKHNRGVETSSTIPSINPSIPIHHLAFTMDTRIPRRFHLTLDRIILPSESFISTCMPSSGLLVMYSFFPASKA